MFPSTMLRAGLLCLAAIGCGTRPPATDEPPSSGGAPVTPGPPPTAAGSITDLSFRPLISTKMACVDGDALERSFLGALPRVTRFTAADTTLTLGTPDGLLLRFAAR